MALKRTTTAIAADRHRSLVVSLIDRRGRVAIHRVASTFGMSKAQLADTIGLGRETLYKASRANATKTQMRVRELFEIITRVTDWAGGKDQAMAWYRAQPIAALGGRTAEALVKAGVEAMLRDYLDHLALGNFA
jgi:DNA-binding XRE family transcriptional regulator